VLLLDIIMPGMDAWDFLKEFESFEPSLKDRIKIYILSSSVDKKDMMKANADKHVEYYLMKPLTSESIHLMVHVLNKKLVKQQ
jgi:response regulator RpfG family c-di-GMP phosphodiesterase